VTPEGLPGSIVEGIVAILRPVTIHPSVDSLGIFAEMQAKLAKDLLLRCWMFRGCHDRKDDESVVSERYGRAVGLAVRLDEGEYSCSKGAQLTPESSLPCRAYVLM